ncbi:MAG: hypothetical protein HPY57_12980 [Ignavibacteria bacterium]|nr:hypothetical protein [Ignavibacteria bacterium]
MEKKVIVSDETDKIEFDSITKAADFLNCARSTVREASKTNRKISNKYTVKIVKEENVVNTNVSNKPNTISSSNNIQINEKGYHLIMGCVHSPYYNEVLMSKIINLTQDTYFKSVIFIGDLSDLSALSKYDVNKVNKGVQLSYEYEVTEELISRFNHIHTKIYLEGNHEYRYEKYLQNLENYKLGAAIESIEKGMHLSRYNVKYIKGYPNNYVDLNGIQLIHGIYTNINSPKKHLDKVKQNVIFAHTHKFAIYNENGITAYNIGFLGDVNADIFSYVSRFDKLNWSNGFCIVYVDDNFNNFVIPIIVTNNKFIFNNKTY